jgi:hypothetical protein
VRRARSFGCRNTVSCLGSGGCDHRCAFAGCRTSVAVHRLRRVGLIEPVPIPGLHSR